MTSPRRPANSLPGFGSQYGVLLSDWSRVEAVLLPQSRIYYGHSITLQSDESYHSTEPSVKAKLPQHFCGTCLKGREPQLTVEITALAPRGRRSGARLPLREPAA